MRGKWDNNERDTKLQTENIQSLRFGDIREGDTNIKKGDITEIRVVNSDEAVWLVLVYNEMIMLMLLRYLSF